jgi:CheY-like chemotaxis protein
LQVEDDGPGMSEEQAARAFTRHFTTKADGSGIGLAVVQDAVTAMGGTVRLSTQTGHGTRFEVELPRAEADSPDRHPSEAQRRMAHPTGIRPSGPPLRSDLGPLSILVVEDDRALRDLMKTTLELRGATVTAVSSLQEVQATTTGFDVALVDFALPDGRGDHVLASLRQQGRVGRAALVTGGSEPAQLDDGAKPDAWLRKPFDLDDLVDTAHRLGTAMAGTSREPRA